MSTMLNSPCNSINIVPVYSRWQSYQIQAYYGFTMAAMRTRMAEEDLGKLIFFVIDVRIHALAPWLHSSSCQGMGHNEFVQMASELCRDEINIICRSHLWSGYDIEGVASTKDASGLERSFIVVVMPTSQEGGVVEGERRGRRL